ncbi:MAG: hypothetical protein ACR2GY_10810 [Phycisphaerales bacterium]
MTFSMTRTLLSTLALAGACTLPAGASDDEIRSARGPVLALIDLSGETEIGQLSEAQQRSLAQQYVPLVLNTADAKPDRLITMRLLGSNLAYDTLNHNRRRHYEEALQVSDNMARKVHERSMNRFLTEIMTRVRQSRPDVRLAVHGLPMEAGALNAQMTSFVNDRYAGTINRLDSYLSDKCLIVSGSGEFDIFRNSTPEAHRFRNGQAVFFKTNSRWRAMYTRGVDEPDLFAGRGFGYYNNGEEENNNNGGGGSGGEPDPTSVFSEVENAGGGNQGGGEPDPAQRQIYFAPKGEYAAEADLSAAPMIENRVVLFYERELGLYPKIKDGQRINGGIPQRVDLQAHLAKVRDDVALLIPETGWDGFAVIDFESWEVAWDRTPNPYRTDSRRLARDRYWTATEDEITRIATREYEHAAHEFMVQTIQLCQELRPNAKWGFWGHGRHWQQQYPQYDFIWELSDAFYPSLYPIYYSVDDNTDERDLETDQRHAQHYRRRVRLYADFLDLFHEDRPVLGFIWRCYAGNPDNRYLWTEINDLDLQMMLEEPWSHGYDGLVLWDKMVEPEERDAFNAFYNNRMGPIIATWQNDGP